MRPCNLKPAPFGVRRLVVLIDKVEAAVVRHEGGDLLAVLDELRAAALADGRVRLLRLDADLRKYRVEGKPCTQAKALLRGEIPRTKEACACLPVCVTHKDSSVKPAPARVDVVLCMWLGGGQIVRLYKLKQARQHAF